MTTILTAPLLIDIDEEFEETLNNMVLVAGYANKLNQIKKNEKIIKASNTINTFFSRTLGDTLKLDVSKMNIEVTKYYSNLKELYPTSATFREIATGRFTSHGIVLGLINNKIKNGSELGKMLSRPLKEIPAHDLLFRNVITEYAIRYNALQAAQQALNKNKRMHSEYEEGRAQLETYTNKLKNEIKIMQKDLTRMRRAAALRIIRMIEKETKR